MNSSSPGHLVVSEVFGPTIQGEGPSAGRRASFVRLGGCNLACSWCDTPYTWDWSRFERAAELRTLPVEEVARDVRAIAAPLVVITGGEPLLQRDGITNLVELLTAVGHQVEIETNGTIAPHRMQEGVRFNVSPKLANSGLPEERRLRPSVLEAFEATGKAIFKFVVRAPQELDEVEAIVRRHGLSDVWISPEGVVADDVIRRSIALIDGVLTRSWSMSSRLHILLWGDERGR